MQVISARLPRSDVSAWMLGSGGGWCSCRACSVRRSAMASCRGWDTRCSTTTWTWVGRSRPVRSQERQTVKDVRLLLPGQLHSPVHRRPDSTRWSGLIGAALVAAQTVGPSAGRRRAACERRPRARPTEGARSRSGVQRTRDRGGRHLGTGWVCVSVGAKGPFLPLLQRQAGRCAVAVRSDDGLGRGYDFAALTSRGSLCFQRHITGSHGGVPDQPGQPERVR